MTSGYEPPDEIGAGDGGGVNYADLPCRDYVELVTDYLEGALPVRQRLVVEAHLAFCAPCVVYLDQMRATLAAVGALRADDVPERAAEVLGEAFRALYGIRDEGE